MKYLFILLVVFNYNVVYAQKYQPLVEEGKYWIYGHYDFSNCFLMGQRFSEIRYFEGDTIILDCHYKKLISAYSKLKDSQYEIYEKKTVCYMREDTLQQKVFMINDNDELFPCSDSVEICIWDFGLQVGDTTTQCVTNMFLLMGEIEGFTHCIIDSVLTYDGGKILYTKGVIPGTCGDLSLSTVYYLEGHGMDVGPIFRKFNVLFHTYCEGTLAECNIISSTKETPLNNYKISIIPNPTTEFIKIETGMDIKGIEIMDQNGMSVLKGNDKEIDVSHLISGVYFVKCISIKSEIYYGKFIKL
jgi:Secretion system C-terminal sorting domain